MSTGAAEPQRDPTPPALLGLVGNLDGREFVISRNPCIVGRDQESDLVIDHALVSRRHARFDTDQSGGVTIVDLGSTYGTFVNGRRIATSPLQNGDRVGFGTEGLIAFSYRGPTAATAPLPPPDSPPPSATITLARAASTIRIGRAPDNDLVLDAPGVSRYHAVLTFDGSGHPTVADSASTNGTFVNGEIVRAPRAIQPADLLFVGGFLLRVDGRDVTKYDLAASRVAVSGIGKQIGQRAVLSDISFAILPREFIGLVGPSGCGKSTLMDAMNGLRPATRGRVLINDLDLYTNFDAIRRSMGYVPQRDVLHDALSVERTLLYMARLRLPGHPTERELGPLIDEVIATVGLSDHRQTPFGLLSGGQQKRLSLAVELITKPSFLFLDEPTSPLDPETSENLVMLFRRLADEGRIVVMVTHKFEKLEALDQIVLLTAGGRLAFYGPPREALRYFSCTEPAQIYKAMAGKKPEDLARTFAASPEHQRYVADRLAESEKVREVTQRVGALSAPASRPAPTQSGWRQWKVLTERYLEIKLKDRRNTLLLIAQAPIVAFILSLIVGDTPNGIQTLFIAAIIAIWFGANNAIREIVGEAPMYRRERLVNLKIPAYILSKFAVLSGIAIIQCALFLAILTALGKLEGSDFVAILTTLSLTAFGGISMGLLFSALVNSTEKAMSVLPLILIPQLLLSGFFKPIDDVYRTGRPPLIRPATAEAFAASEALRSQDKPRPTGTARIVEPVERVDGLGPVRYGTIIILARWSIDGLVHAVSRGDVVARAVLASQITVPAYSRVHAGDPEADVRGAFGNRMRLDWLVLLLSSAACLGLTGWALKRKDTL